MQSQQSHHPRVIFMGSGPFAEPALDLLSDNYPTVGVVTQPDRAAGRGRRIVRGAIASKADDRGIPVLQPLKLRDSDFLQEMRDLAPDLFVVASYGRILPQSLLDLPSRGCLNLHPSLLPRHRGASPVAWSILSGDNVTGVTVIEMVAAMDAGPIMAQCDSVIEPEDTTESLTARLARENARLLIESLPAWLDGTSSSVPQDDSKATYTKMLTKEMGAIDWTDSASTIERRVRAFIPWPVAFTTWRGDPIRILKSSPRPQPKTPDHKPGTVLGVEGSAILVQTGQGVLEVDVMQPAGGRPMPPSDFLRGHPLLLHAQLGEST